MQQCRPLAERDERHDEPRRLCCWQRHYLWRQTNSAANGPVLQIVDHDIRSARNHRQSLRTTRRHGIAVNVTTSSCNRCTNQCLHRRARQLHGWRHERRHTGAAHHFNLTAGAIFCRPYNNSNLIGGRHQSIDLNRCSVTLDKHHQHDVARQQTDATERAAIAVQWHVRTDVPHERRAVVVGTDHGMLAIKRTRSGIHSTSKSFISFQWYFFAQQFNKVCKRRTSVGVGEHGHSVFALLATNVQQTGCRAARTTRHCCQFSIPRRFETHDFILYIGAIYFGNIS
mmetsp:Transcript_17347/g.30228  ORF Transcript_17347/g.30228 Transcript_17347/m.30228 type:complete len:284 (-) Transcript_17347:2275-3126(-)